jgi:hypothetical protein
MLYSQRIAMNESLYPHIKVGFRSQNVLSWTVCNSLAHIS